MIQSIGFKIKSLRELKPWAHFLLHKGIKVKYNALKMNDENIGQLSETCALSHFWFLLTLFTQEVIDRFTGYKFIQTLIERRQVLYFQWEIVIILEIIAHIATPFACKLLTHSSSKDVREQPLLMALLSNDFKSLKCHIEEFLRIWLNGCISRVSFVIFKGEAESEWIIGSLLRELQTHEYLLELMKDIVVFFPSLILFDLGS